MKICMFTNTYLPHVGGVARSVASFAADLRSAGHRVLIIAPTFSGHEEHDKTEADIFRVPAIQQFNGSDFSVRIPSPFLVDEQMDEMDPDIIHSHHPYLLGDAALRAARRRDLPLIFTHHTLYEEYAHYISRNPENMKRFAAFLSTNYANLCDYVVAPSDSIKTLIGSRGVKTPAQVIPTGVDVPLFSKGNGSAFRKAFNIPEDAFVIGHLGRLAPEKNLDYLAGAVARAVKQHPHARFLVAGGGPSRDAIQQVFAKAEIADRLVMVGKVTGQQLVDTYHAMDLFAFASKTETQGMVLTEAMAAGLPVVALDAPGVREVVRDGKNGRLLAGDASEDRFSAALEDILSRPRQIHPWSREAGTTARSFARERSAKRLSKLYAEAIDRRLEESHNKYKTGKLDFWDKFLLACQAEWDLAAEKTESIIQTIDEDEKMVGLDE